MDKLLDDWAEILKEKMSTTRVELNTLHPDKHRYHTLEGYIGGLAMALAVLHRLETKAEKKGEIEMLSTNECLRYQEVTREVDRRATNQALYEKALDQQKPRVVIWMHGANNITSISASLGTDVLIINTDVEYVELEDRRCIEKTDVEACVQTVPPSPNAVGKAFAEYGANIKVEVGA